MEVRLLLLGKRGSGKSATGNSILGKAVFESRFSEQPVTRSCQRRSGVTQGREVVVIDTPDIFSSDNIKRCLELSAPSLHALLLVIPLGNYTVEDRQIAEHIQNVFEEKARRHTIIIFTWKDEEGSLEDYVKNDTSIRDLVQRSSGQYCAFNNKASKDERDAQVKELLCKVEDLVENKGPYAVNLRDEDSRFQDSVNEDTSQRSMNEDTSQRKDHPHEALEARQESESEWGSSRMEVRLLLLGKRGSGKSATGNSILGKAVFESRFSEQPVTRSCQRRSGVTQGREVVVIDTPDIFSSDNIKRCLELSAPSLHALLLVIPLGNYTVEDRQIAEHIQNVFEEKARRHTIIIFTWKDEEGSLEDYVKNDTSIRDLVQRSSGQYCAFNNKASKDERDAQVKELLCKVEDLVENKGPYAVNLRDEDSRFQDSVNEDTSQRSMNEDTSQRKDHPHEALEARQESESEWGSSRMEVRLLLLGKRGSGKSATGNSILGKAVFESRFSEQPVTRSCQRRSGVTQGREVVVIDTPDIFSSDNIKRCLELSAPSLHALLLVIPLGNYTVEDRQIAEHIQNVFEEKARRHTIIIFTWKDEEGSLEDYVKNDTSIRDLVQRSSGQYCAFNNKASKDERDAQVKELLCKVEDLVENKGPYAVNLRDEDSRFQDSVNEDTSQRSMNEDTSQRKDHPHEALEARQESESEWGSSRMEVRLLLLGKRGSGKSATGNSILGKAVFESRFSEQPVTRSCQRRSGVTQGREVVVIDTPDIFSSDNIKRCLELSAPSLHALLLVIPLGNYTVEDRQIAEHIQNVFEEKARRHTIIIFTWKDEEGSLEDYVKNDTSIRDLVQRSSGQYCAFNNKASKDERDAQVKELLCKVEDLVENKGPYAVNLRDEDSRFQDSVNEDTSQRSMNEDTSQRKDHPHEALEARQESESEWGSSRMEVRLLLLGKRGSGKSATGNSILGKAVFESRFSEQPVTRSCQRRSGVTQGREVVVIDTPDIFSSDNIKRCLELSAPSLHALLLVIPLGNYTVEDRQIAEHIQNVFEEKARRHTIIIFTWKDEEGSLEDYVKNDTSIRDLVQRSSGQYCAFNNKASKDERDAQVKELLCKVEDLVENKGPYAVNLRDEDSRFQDSVNEDTSQRSMNEDTSQRKDHPHGSGEQHQQMIRWEPSPGLPALKVLLVGKRGVGKSAVGNSLLGKRVFETRYSEEPVTWRCMSEGRIWRERQVLIMDTPDVSSSKDIEQDLVNNIYPGPHAFLLVTPLGSFNEKDDMVLSTIQRIFGDKFIEYMIVLLTRKEDLENQDLEKFLARSKRLNELISKCKNRYSVFNYRAREEEKPCQVDKLLQEIVSMVQQNGNKPCTFREKEALLIILVGKSGTGKSASGNTILGSPEFHSQLKAQPVTTSFQEGRRTWNGQDVVVVDTPPLFQESRAERDLSQLEKAVKDCRSYYKEGSTVLVVVLQLGRVTTGDKKAVVDLEHIFGAEVMKYMIVLFTRKEDLETGNLDDYVNNTDNKYLKSIIEKCKGRYCAFNNKETGQAREDQAAELLTMASEVIKGSGQHKHPRTWDVGKIMKNIQEKPSKLLNNLKEMF